MAKRIKTNEKLEIIIRRLDDEVEYLEKIAKFHPTLEQKYTHIINAIKWCKWIIKESENIRVY